MLYFLFLRCRAWATARCRLTLHEQAYQHDHPSLCPCGRPAYPSQTASIQSLPHSSVRQNELDEHKKIGKGIKIVLRFLMVQLNFWGHRLLRRLRHAQLVSVSSRGVETSDGSSAIASVNEGPEGFPPPSLPCAPPCSKIWVWAWKTYPTPGSVRI